MENFRKKKNEMKHTNGDKKREDSRHSRDLNLREFQLRSMKHTLTYTHKSERHRNGENLVCFILSGSVL